MSQQQIMTEIERVLGEFPAIQVQNRCAKVYAESHRHSGCYLSRTSGQDKAKEVGQALVKAGVEPQGLLRLDFGAWSTVLRKDRTDVSFLVETITSSPDTVTNQEEYKSKMTFALSDSLQK